MHIEHDHGHDHSHDHGHTHSHEHTHTHTHEHTHGGASDKDTALLKYMLDHNRQHARELEESAAKLKSAGKSEAAAFIAEAVHYFGHGNDELEKAVALLESE